MGIGASLRRVMTQRRLFIPWIAGIFASAMMVPAWLAMGQCCAPVYVVALLASVGGGWVFAIYMWNLSEAQRTAWEPWVKVAAKEDEKRDA